MKKIGIIAGCLIATVALAQVSYWFRGFERQASAPLARNYLGTAWLATNSPPTNAYVGGAAFLWNSNSVVYLLTTAPGSMTWGATNKLGP